MGLVDETALELAAKAEIRTATCYGKIGDYEAGVASFRRVITRFASERKLVEEAYLRLADMYEQRGDFDESVRTYREAIDISSDRSLRARIQFALQRSSFLRRRIRMRSLSLGSTSKATVILLATLVFPRIAFTIAWVIAINNWRRCT